MAYDFSENVQRGILYLAKYNKDFFSQITPLVKPEYFEFPVHSTIYNSIVEFHSKYQSIPCDDFILEVCKKNKDTKEDTSDYSDELILINRMDTSSIGNEDFFLDEIEIFARKEAMKEAITRSIEFIQTDDFERVEEEVRSALTVNRNVDLGQNYFDSITDRWIRTLDKNNEDRFRTILPTLNRELEGGLSTKELAMVVAPPGVGKSIFLVNQGVHSLMEGRKVLYVSLEMSEDKIAQRFDSVMTLLGQRSLPMKQKVLQERLEVFKQNFPGGQLVIKEFPTGVASVSTIRSLLSQLKNFEGFTPDLLIVDYLELLGTNREGPEYQTQELLARELRGIAVEHQMLVWTATQTNRQGTRVNVITDAELGDSYGKFRTVDYALSLNQTEEEFDEERMRCYVMKSRNGKTRFVTGMSIDYNTLSMSELSTDAETHEP
jgi:replicative DNA helicase